MTFTFDTTHHALWAEEVALAGGVLAEIVPAPPAAHARCNLALQTLADQGELLADLLGSEGVAFAIYDPEQPDGAAGGG